MDTHAEPLPDLARANLDAADLTILALALDTLSHHADAELAEARKRSNSAKQLALIALRQRIATTRAKVQALQALQVLP